MKRQEQATKSIPLLLGGLKATLIQLPERCLIAIPMESMEIPDQLQEWLEEFQLQKEVDLPMVIKNIKYDISSQQFFITQEPYDSILKQVLHHNGDKFCYQQKLDLINQLAVGLKELKVKNIVHRDLRPQTIALQKKKKGYHAKFLLLKEAVVLNEENNFETNQKCLYLNEFTAPEICQRKKHSFQADIWSLGFLFYFLLFGNLKGIKIQFGKTLVEFPENTPNWMEQILTNMLAYDPSKRYRIDDVLNRMKFLIQCGDTASKFMPKTL